MRRSAWLAGVLAAPLLLTGCVERRFVIESTPPGAAVAVNDKPLPGLTPADGFYVFHGAYDFTLVRDGYATLKVHQPIPPKWYEVPPLDFVSENLVPWTIRDVRRFCYTLQPLQMPNSQEVVQRAQELQARGQAIGAPAPPRPETAPPPPTMPPAAGGP
jgi:hypothetical protein